MIWLLLLFLFITICYLWLIAPDFSHREEMRAYHGFEFAHRGYWNMSSYIPENSMAAFQAALHKGLGIELDLHLTKDGQLVVFHDDTLSRMCGIDKTIESMTYNELSHLYLNGTSERIPLFSEVLKLINGRVPLLIELKIPSRDLSLCPKTLMELQNYTGKYLVQSFNSLGIYWFRKNAPHVLRGQLSSNLTESDSSQPYLARFSVRFLLTNVLTRPDFISYKLKDHKNLSLFLHHKLFRTTIAVWTLRTKEAFDYGKSHYNITIFEKH